MIYVAKASNNTKCVSDQKCEPDNSLCKKVMEEQNKADRAHALHWGSYKVRQCDTIDKVIDFLYTDYLNNLKLSKNITPKEKEIITKKVREEIRNCIIKENKLNQQNPKLKAGKVILVPSKPKLETFVKKHKA